MPSIWIEASMVKCGDSLVANNDALEIVNIVPFMGYVWMTNVNGETFVTPETDRVNVICEYDSYDYEYEVASDEEYDRREREWMEEENRHYEERCLFFLVSHIEPSIMDGWFSG